MLSSMKVVILGAGRVGLQLAKQLIEEKKEVTIIEKDMKKAENISRQLDCMVVNDAGNSIETLEKAETAKADFFISLTESDETNMIACALVSSSCTKPVTIARVRNADYSRTWTPDKSFLGINHIVNPEIEVAKAIYQAVEHGAVGHIISFENANLQMRNMVIDRDSSFCGIQIKELRSSMQTEFIVATLLRDNKMILPTGDTVLREGDQIWVLASEEDFGKFLTFINKPKRKLDKIVIAGGGNIGSYIAEFLMEEDKREAARTVFQKLKRTFLKPRKKTVHIIESDYELCKQLSERYPEALVTHADISEEQLLEEGRFTNYDLLITATGNQELNIITAAHARKTGIPLSMALVRKTSYSAMARELGIDVAISINETLVNSLLTIIRKGSVKSVYTLAESNLEMVELSLDSKPEMVSRAIKDIHLPKDTLIIMVSRNNETIIPYGDLVLNASDHLLVIARKENIRDLE